MRSILHRSFRQRGFCFSGSWGCPPLEGESASPTSDSRTGMERSRQIWIDLVYLVGKRELSSNSRSLEFLSSFLAYAFRMLASGVLSYSLPLFASYLLYFQSSIGHARCAALRGVEPLRKGVIRAQCPLTPEGLGGGSCTPSVGRLPRYQRYFVADGMTGLPALVDYAPMRLNPHRVSFTLRPRNCTALLSTSWQEVGSWQMTPSLTPASFARSGKKEPRRSARSNRVLAGFLLTKSLVVASRPPLNTATKRDFPYTRQAFSLRCPTKTFR